MIIYWFASQNISQSTVEKVLVMQHTLLKGHYTRRRTSCYCTFIICTCWGQEVWKKWMVSGCKRRESTESLQTPWQQWRRMTDSSKDNAWEYQLSSLGNVLVSHRHTPTHSTCVNQLLDWLVSLDSLTIGNVSEKMKNHVMFIVYMLSVEDNSCVMSCWTREH